MPCSKTGREGNHSARTLARSVAAGSRRGQDHDLLHVRLPLRHQASTCRTAASATSRATATTRSTMACSCAKGSAGIMQHYSPARLTKPLMRVGERGAGEFREIEWDEALATATHGSSAIRARRSAKARLLHRPRPEPGADRLVGAPVRHPQLRRPRRLLLGQHGGRPASTRSAARSGSSASPTGSTPAISCCSACAEDHDSNPIKIGLGKLKAKGVKFVSVNPVRTGYSAIADEWLGITPGTDGLFVLALVHELLRAGKVDLDYLTRYTNAPWLVIDDPGSADHGLFARDDDGVPLVWDRIAEAPRPANDAGAKLALKGEVTLTDGRRARPVFHLLAERYLADDYSPDAVAARTGIPAATIRKIAAELAAGGVRRAAGPRPALDRCLRPAPRADGRPAGQHARDARHLGARQRLSHLPRAASVADPARQHRCPGRLPLQAAVPEADPAGTEARRPRRPGGRRPAPGRAAARLFRPARRTSWSRRTARRGGSTRRSPGTRRSLPMA